MRVAIDTGGTFTDCVYLRDGKFVVLKVFSTPQDPGHGGAERIAADRGGAARLWFGTERRWERTQCWSARVRVLPL